MSISLDPPLDTGFDWTLILGCPAGDTEVLDTDVLTAIAAGLVSQTQLMFPPLSSKSQYLKLASKAQRRLRNQIKNVKMNAAKAARP